MENYIITYFAIVCRVGACVAVVPGFASARVPIKVRLFLVLALSGILSIEHMPGGGINGITLNAGVGLITNELIAGLILGFVYRTFISALEYASVATASLVGLNGLGVGIERDEVLPSIASMMAAAATLILIELDFHEVVMQNLFDSFSFMPLGHVPSMGFFISLLVAKMNDAFAAAIAFCAPYLIYSLFTNAAFGLLGRLIPQVQTFFVSIPLLVLGGVLVAFYTVRESLTVFCGNMVRWLSL